jgi:hypothetical protein
MSGNWKMRKEASIDTGRLRMGSVSLRLLEGKALL